MQLISFLNSLFKLNMTDFAIFTLRYAMANNGKSVKGTKYNRAGCAALNT